MNLLPPAACCWQASNEFYIYVSHYKASSGSSNEAKRLGEAQIIRTNEAIDLPATARVLYVGDYNVDDSGEAGYQTILSNTAPNGIQRGQGIDPLNVTNNQNIQWSSSTSDTNILVMLTEHDYDLEYRDDLQVMTTNVYSGMPGGLKYIPGTCHAFANNGQIPYYGTVNSGTNTALNNRLVTNGPVFINAAQIYLDLTGASDHLPVMADYTIPMPTPGITGASLAGADLVLSVTNGVTERRVFGAHGFHFSGATDQLDDGGKLYGHERCFHLHGHECGSSRRPAAVFYPQGKIAGIRKQHCIVARQPVTFTPHGTIGSL